MTSQAEEPKPDLPEEAQDGPMPPASAGQAGPDGAETMAPDGLPAAEEPAPDAEAPDPALLAAAVRLAEALVYASDKPVTPAMLGAILPEGLTAGTVMAALAEACEGRGVVLMDVAGGWVFRTAPDLAQRLTKVVQAPRRLPRAAMEALSIIAYHQPCTRADIEDVRGVAVSPGSLDQLMEIGWIRMRGRRRSAPGRPLLYGTTQAFLEHFNLESVTDLPGMADLKAAGLLDARLPPGFAVPAPSDDLIGDDIEEIGEETEFVTDFHEADSETAD